MKKERKQERTEKNMKKYRFGSLIVLSLLLVVCFSAAAKADTINKISASGEVINIQTSLLVRNAPSASGSVLGSLKNGAAVSITGETDAWYRIIYGSKEAFVSKSYISASPLNNESVVDFRASAHVKVDGHLNVRSGASMSASVLGMLDDGKGVDITGETADWYRITYGSGEGFVSKQYISFSSQGGNSSSVSKGTVGTVRVNTTLLVRKQPSRSGSIAGYLTNGKTVEITGEADGYYQIRYNSSTAYVSKEYVTIGGSTSASGYSSVSSGDVSSVSKTGYANVSSSLLVRSEASSSAGVMGRLNRGAAITITGETTNWYQIRYAGKTGYVNKAYVSFSEVSSDGFKSVSLNVPLYHQYDSRWSSVRIGRETLKSAGCVTTCLAMTYQYRTGNVCTPAQMAGKLSYTSSGNVYWPSGTTQYTGSNYLSVIYQQLAAGNPVIVGAKSAGGLQHYVVVTGYDGSSSLSASGFTVNDPGRSGAKTLKAFFSRTPQFYKLIYYH